ncbi:Peptidyl-prolyl cis-trans isomerase cyp15 [Exophiala dermatitidis]|uniref:Peptidyl-prolyl cis-trans isomerase-like 1 n=2 Tax=Exophiala dermatitidis TaxID=5970 RepID=H6BK13_EXODN|nr:peptidylprolyl isomerase [Exophiala dermatitidis NIH/UT8656]KAJ4512527.1 Peptidyl-prolyl cis-trans isomerase cyp15 [Exophiala dermatitidis]EHY52467.1 peptidylprolyl isomerase [Exophiala dermatitidis NIH/UT8656]KAJ4512599.1 Peptidyl-prolyl cis-trans isomerase cyp15 [Exophiala dermatitidis]KAJ4542395.1 Peptidyl-prolyl cis-trans isomerase cyp15 [Exophiala dermatitidis]KAJ4580016.1 Peptidyl-prolyl cis-trans isomerase cyp15 [Exophiala dermatitidis]
MSDAQNLKRPRPEDPSHSDDESSDDDFGPALPSSVPPKKKRRLPYESLYVDALPKGVRYSKSLMHKDQVSTVTIAPSPADFVITTSIDGVVKFWKKMARGIEFAKEYLAHESRIVSSSVSVDGALFATTGDEGDNTIKIFDVITFDLLTILNLASPATCLCWVHRKGTAPVLAAGIGKEIHIYDGRGDSPTPMHVLSSLHRAPVVAMAYNPAFDCVVSADEGGMVEYWQPSDNYEKPDTVFKMKSTTNLFDFKKSKSAPCSITISPSGHQFATISFPDRKIRVFDFASGKLYRSYDESIETITAMQQAGTALQKLDEVEFGRRMAVERELDNPAVRSRINVIFDESGHFIAYGSLLGVKVVNTLTNRVIKAYGKDEPFRALNIALYQGAPQKKEVVTVSMAASANPLLNEAEERDPMLFATGYGKVRFYMFTNEEDISKSTRDVQNEKPRIIGGKKKEEKQAQTGTSAVLHTTYGDIHIRLFPDKAPKTVENFVTHARNGYYNNTIFHRVIRKFMIQGGDPLGDGTGGESIWGKEFEDEFSDLKHDKPYTVSMANAGPNTNGSQFFITTEKTPFLDGKHTIFGRAYQGLDVIHQIENTKVHKEKPVQDIKIVNISIN